MSFVPDLPAEQVHARLQSALDAYQKAEQNAVIWFSEIAARKLYLELGCSSLQQYAMEELGFSEARYHQFQRLSERLDVLPELRRSVQDGSIPWTNAREVAAVATPATDKAWVDVARSSSRRELRKQIDVVRGRQKAARRASLGSGQTLFEDGPPTGSGSTAGSGSPAMSGSPAVSAETLQVMAGVALQFTPEQLAAFESLLETAMKSGERGKREEMVLALMARGVKSQPTAAQHDTRVHPSAYHDHSPIRIIVQACPECGKGSVNTGRGATPLTLVELEALSCDAVIERDGKNRATIPPRLRRQALARAGYRCQAAGCGLSLFLCVHHVVFREDGGPNTLENLIVLCSGCHRALHRLAERRMSVEPDVGRREAMDARARSA